MSKEKEEPQNQPAVVQKAASEKFTNAVQKEFSANVGELSLTPFQKKLIQNYFIRLDRTLKDAETKRLAKGQNGDAVPVSWDNINMPKLAQDVVALSSVGLDPLQNNHVNLLPYKNNSTGKYDIVPMPGYKGMEIVAKKFALEIPDDVIIELVYQNDVFKPIKKNSTTRIESYEFDITDPWNRGEIVGGFYYIVFFDKPEKNQLKFLNRDAIEKRKPAYASVEFWGGEKDEWKNGKKTGEKTKIEGWFDEMAYKTICRACYNSFTIDSEKINAQFLDFQEIEQRKIPAIETTADQMKIEVKNESVGQDVEFEEIPKTDPTEQQKEIQSLSDKLNDGKTEENPEIKF